MDHPPYAFDKENRLVQLSEQSKNEFLAKRTAEK
jgi:hypothetical protein